MHGSSWQSVPTAATCTEALWPLFHFIASGQEMKQWLYLHTHTYTFPPTIWLAKCCWKESSKQTSKHSQPTCCETYIMCLTPTATTPIPLYILEIFVYDIIDYSKPLRNSAHYHLTGKLVSNFVISESGWLLLEVVNITADNLPIINSLYSEINTSNTLYTDSRTHYKACIFVSFASILSSSHIAACSPSTHFIYA